jgi:hypothetical protein
MSKHPVLILDDKDEWLGQLNLYLSEEGFRCLLSRTGQDAIDKVKQDYSHSIKVMISDELLLVNGEDDGERQQYQGKDVRQAIHKIRPDIQFIVISDLPYREAKKTADIDIGYRKAMQMTADLSQGDGVIAMVDKFSLQSPEIKQEKYQWLFKVIRNAQGEAPTSKKAGLYIGFAVPQTRYQKMFETLGIKPATEIQLHDYHSHYNKILANQGVDSDRGKFVNDFLRKSGITPNMKEFLESIPEKKQEKENFIQNLPYRIDQVFKRKMNSNRLVRQAIDIQSSRFRILMILARKSEIGTNIVITEQDYPYGKRTTKITDLGNVGLSQYSLENAIDINSSSDLQPTDRFVDLVSEDIAFQYDGSEKTRKVKSTIRRENSSNPLKTAISRFNKELVEEKFGQFDRISVPLGDKTVSGWQPSFQTGIILYPSQSE